MSDPESLRLLARQQFTSCLVLCEHYAHVNLATILKLRSSIGDFLSLVGGPVVVAVEYEESVTQNLRVAKIFALKGMINMVLANCGNSQEIALLIHTVCTQIKELELLAMPEFRINTHGGDA